MEKQEYIKKKIIDFEQKHYYMDYLNNANDPELKRSWKRELQQQNAKWQNIRCTKDVMDLIERFEGCVSLVERYVKVGHIKDGYDMALALYNALLGLKKMAQCINLSGEYANFAGISIEDIESTQRPLNVMTYKAPMREEYHFSNVR